MRRLAAVCLLAACSSPPAVAPEPATGAGAGSDPSGPVAAATGARSAPSRSTARLRNGATAVVQQAPGGPAALLQLGVAAGTLLLAPGAAELALHVVAEAGDAANGRASLRRQIEQLGGVLQTHVGPLSSWLDVRVEADRWPEAVQAVAAALAAPPPTRAEFEHVRRELVAARTAALGNDPAGAMARLLLLGERDVDAYLRALVDRDASDAANFLARGWRPELTTVVLVGPAEPAAALAALDAADRASVGSWRSSSEPSPLPVLDRRFDSGLWWSPASDAAAAAAPCRLAVVIPLPASGEPTAADELLALGCLTLEGLGGRMARVFADRGLERVEWRATTTATADATALVLRTEAASDQVGAIWRALTAARTSLQSVPPSPAEIAQAQTHAPVLARLPLLDDGDRARRLRGDTAGINAIDVRLAELGGLADAGPDMLRQGVDRLLARPFACVVVGGAIASDVPGVLAFRALPSTAEAPAGSPLALPTLPVAPIAPIAPPPIAPDNAAGTTAAGATPVAAPNNLPAGGEAPARTQPWLDQAATAAGGPAALRRLQGWHSRAVSRHGRSPELLDDQRWRGDGALTRTRTVLGQDLVTTIVGDAGTERLGETVKELDAAAIAAARHEMRRHPLALLAAHVRGEMTFRTVSTRDAGDRKLAVLETADGGFERLRLHIDVESHLVRAVESWATMPDGSVVHLHEAWQDYRAVGVLRAPFHRLTTQDDNADRTATSWSEWQPVFADAPK
ncbi:MAG: hypothetical protein ACK539_12805 [Planctomycetota bacterium]